MSFKAEQIMLTVVNTGEGYRERCGLARESAVSVAQHAVATRWLQIARNTARDLRNQFGDTFTTRDILEAAILLADYYAEHVKECDESSRISREMEPSP
jgi:hypothetical protein